MFLVTKNFKNENELFAKAYEENNADKNDLANFLLSCSLNSFPNLIVTAWKMEKADVTVPRNQLNTWI